MSSRRFAVLMAATLMSALAWTPVAPGVAQDVIVVAPSPAAASPESANALVYSTVVPAVRTPSGWTGNVSTCDPGTISLTARAAALGSVNAFRQLSGLEPVVFDDTASSQAQAAALIMAANNTLSHYPPPSWACWSQAGYDGASHSNLAMGYAGMSLLEYMYDQGPTNTAAGHRRWILNPKIDIMGFGATSSSNALYVVTPEDVTNARPDWIPWPPAGHVPIVLEPDGRWSLSASQRYTYFGNATVSVLGPSGPVPATVVSTTDSYGPDTIVWQLAEPPQPTTTVQTFHVTVSGITNDAGQVAPVEYDVHLLPRPPVEFTTLPVVQGELVSGQVIRVSKGSTQPSGGDVSYAWFRDGRPIAGAFRNSLLLDVADEGTSVSVRVTRSGVENYADTPLMVTAGMVEKGRLALLKRPKLFRDRVHPKVLRVSARFNLTGARISYRWSKYGQRVAVTRQGRLRVMGKHGPGVYRVIVVARLAEHGRVKVATNKFRMR